MSAFLRETLMKARMRIDGLLCGDKGARFAQARVATLLQLQNDDMCVSNTSLHYYVSIQYEGALPRQLHT